MSYEGKFHYIGIAGDKKLSLARYMLIVKTAKENPDKMFSQSFCSWSPETGETIIKEWMDGINDRINAKDPRYPQGAKAQPLYQTELQRDYRAYLDRRDKRIIVRQWQTPLFRKRFSHLLFVD
jgi:hypothetical protein